MSEEFSTSLSFKAASPEHVSDIQMLFEHLDMDEEDEARALLARYRIDDAQQRLKGLLPPYSEYGSDDDLIEMYLGTRQDNGGDERMTFSGLDGEIEAEGYDHGAPDYVAALVLIVLAVGGREIRGGAGSPFWRMRWNTDAAGEVRMTYVTED